MKIVCNGKDNTMFKKNHVVRLVLIFTLIMGVSSLAVMLGGTMRARNNSYITIDPETIELVQLNAPKEGDPIAVVDTSLGEYRFVLYPQYSPNAVANFTELANSGYYNNTYVFHSESGVYSASGAPNKDGSANDSSHELVERELNQNLWPFKGAVCVMTTTLKQSFKEKCFGGGTYYNGSRFLTLNTVSFDEDFQKELRESSESEALAEAFIKHGGVPNFSQQMTVIGQTYSGMDVVEKLASLETNNAGIYKFPKEDVIIKSVTIGTYSEKDEDTGKK
ncbi:peptidylprolyl isomerase [Ruminococcus flavefaciens]|uniref:peptidylprolyl isomerase n=1 Tax=Ruminococcus flavefaciens TaxID=1265 RepID=UPI0002DFE430|nr:peptidylprolyl isomerase [Ruminococcus flavefaciens]